jgi:hypothetical protein
VLSIVYLFPYIWELGQGGVLTGLVCAGIFRLWAFYGVIFWCNVKINFAADQKMILLNETELSRRAPFQSKLETLEKMLQNPSEFQEFEHFLRNQSNALDLYFWKAVDDILRIQDPFTFRERVMRLKENLMLIDGFSLVEGDMSSFESMTNFFMTCDDLNDQQFQDQSQVCLRFAQQEVLLLLTKNSFVRFQLREHSRANNSLRMVEQ